MTFTPNSPARLTVSERIERACVTCVPLGVLLMFVGLLTAGYIPAVPADYSATEVAAFYRDGTNLIRLGIVLTLIGFMVWGPLIVVITRQMLRIRPEQKALAYLQFGVGLASWQFLLVPLLVLAAATFRPERNPEVKQALHDLGWIMPFMPFVLQSFAIALAVLLDTGPTPVFPRWLAYFNLLECFLFLPAMLLTFFKTGPFAYHGLLVFWVPLGVFGLWMLVMAWGPTGRSSAISSWPGGLTVSRACMLPERSAPVQPSSSAVRLEAPESHPRTGHVPGAAGVWVLLLGEMSMFGLFFGIFMDARAGDRELFARSQQNLSVTIGLVNTVVLLASSLFVVQGVRVARGGEAGRASRFVTGQVFV